MKWLQRQRTLWCRVCHEGGEKPTPGSWGTPLPRPMMVWDIAGAWKWSWSSYLPWDSISLPRSILCSQLTGKTENTSMIFHICSLPSHLTACPGSALGKIGLWGCSLKRTRHSPGPTRTMIIQGIHSLPLFMKYCYGLNLSPQNSYVEDLSPNISECNYLEIGPLKR